MNLLWAAALLVAQDVGGLIAELANEDPAARDRAVEGLVAAGAAAEEALRRASGSADPDVALRARTALQRIDLARRAAPFSARLSAELLAKVPWVLESLVDGSEESMLELVRRTRGIGTSSRYLGSEVKVDPKLLGPPFEILWERIKEARAAGRPMARLESVFAVALYWRSDQPNSASGGSSIMIDAISTADLATYYLDHGIGVDGWLLDSLLRASPPYGVPGLAARLLEKSDMQSRKVGARLAGLLGLREGIPKLRDLVGSGDGELVIAACESLSMLGDRESAPKIAEALGRVRTWEGRKLVRALVRLGAVEQAAALVEAGEGAEPDLRAHIVEGLGELRAPELDAVLEEWAPTLEQSYHRQLLVGALGKVRSDAARALLKTMAGEAGAKSALAEALAAAGEREALAGLLEDNAGWEGARVLEILVREGIAGAPGKIVEAVQGGDVWMIDAAGRLGLAAEELSRLAREGEKEPAERAARALPAEAVDAALLASPHDGVRNAALRALIEREAPVEAEAILPLLDRPETRAAALEALAVRFPDRARPLLKNEGKPEERLAAARAMGRIDLAAAAAWMKELLQEKAVWMEAARWLVERGDRAPVDALSAEMRRKPGPTGDAAVDLLLMLGEPAAAEGLQRRMERTGSAPVLFNAVAAPEAWAKLRASPVPAGAPARPTLEELAAWLSGRGTAMRFDPGVRSAYRTDRVSTDARNLAELLERVHAVSIGSSVRLETGGGVLIEAAHTARERWWAWCDERRKP